MQLEVSCKVLFGGMNYKNHSEKACVNFDGLIIK